MALEIAESDLRKKARLEGSLRRELRVFNKRLEATFEQAIIATGQAPPPLASAQRELSEILGRHYGRTESSFQGRLSRSLQSGLRATAAEQEAISQALAGHFQRTQSEQALRILSTTQKEMARALDAANASRRAAEAAGRLVSTEEFAAEARGALRQSNKGRLNPISVFETQTSAEIAKMTELEVLAGAPPSLGETQQAMIPVEKRWDSQGDSDVRADHINADSQLVLSHLPFVVGPDRLMFPGDGSLGAPLGQRAGCRCSSRYDPDQLGALRERRLAA